MLERGLTPLGDHQVDCFRTRVLDVRPRRIDTNPQVWLGMMAPNASSSIIVPIRSTTLNRSAGCHAAQFEAWRALVLLSGTRAGITLGSPISFQIVNRDATPFHSRASVTIFDTEPVAESL
jgi:hypothetical protein